MKASENPISSKLTTNQRKSLVVYGDCVLEAMQEAKIAADQALDVVVDTDAFAAELGEMAEFAVGFLHGSAEMLDVKVEELWAYVASVIAERDRKSKKIVRKAKQQWGMAS